MSVPSPTKVTVCRCYIRVSKKDQRPEVQRAQMETYCASRGWSPVFYEERMKGTRNDRPEFLRAIGDALKNLSTQPQAFLVWALDRFGRDMVFLLGQFQALEAAGVTVVSLAESWTEHDDDNKPIKLGVTSGMAASELRRLRRRTGAAQALARSQGKHIGRPFKNLSLLQEAARLVVSGTCSIRAAAQRVSHGLPKKPEQPGGLCKISEATLRRFLDGTWKGPTTGGGALHSSCADGPD
jgi:DNA invertase Pin-like site-specific DNA recombinase